MRSITLALLGALAVSAASAQSLDQDIAAGHAALQCGEYLKADRLLKAAAFGPDGAIRDEGAFGSWEQLHPMLTGETPVGGSDPAPGDQKGPDPQAIAALAVSTPKDAIAQIVHRARSTNIVILNEAHDSPRDRAFALEVARALRPLGFSYLAAETFNNASDWAGRPSNADKLLRDGFVRRASGYYTADPVFAGFVREALRLGYAPVLYEQTYEQGLTSNGSVIARREEAEAHNLQAFLSTHPGARLLVHVGYSHVAEAPLERAGNRELWMAARLKHLTGIDPLTIDQTGITDTSRSQEALYAAAAARIDRPAVFMTGDRPLVLGQYAGAVDLQVVHPRRSYRHGRPAWMAKLGGHPVAIPPSLLPANGQRLIQVFAADAPADAVPLDQVLIEVGKPFPKLMVPPGKLRFAVQDPT